MLVIENEYANIRFPFPLLQCVVSDPGSAIWIKHSDTADSSKFLAHGDRFFDNTIPLSKYRLNHIGRTYFLHITGTILPQKVALADWKKVIKFG